MRGGRSARLRVDVPEKKNAQETAEFQSNHELVENNILKANPDRGFDDCGGMFA